MKHPQLYVKAVAVSKLCFLQMLGKKMHPENAFTSKFYLEIERDTNVYFSGYEMNWAAFHIVEIMASTKLRYLIFHDDTNSLLKRPKMERYILSKSFPIPNILFSTMIHVILYDSYSMSYISVRNDLVIGLHLSVLMKEQMFLC